MSKKSEEHFTRIAVEIIDKSSDGIIVIDDRNEIIYANPAWKEMHGFDPEKVISTQKVFELLFPDPEKRRESIELWNHDLALETPPVREWQRQALDGNNRWYRFQVLHLDNSLTMVKVIDINERKLLELQFKSIFEQAPDAIILHDAKTGKIIDFNEKAVELSGYTREELPNISVFNMGASQTAKDMILHAEDVVRRGHDYFESSIKRKNGEIRHAVISTTALEIGSRKMIQAIVHDITDRKLAENALKESEQIMQRIIEQSPIPMVIASMDGVIEHINMKAIQTFGYLREDVPSLERLFEKAYPDKKYRQEVISTWTGLVETAVREQREIESAEYHITCKDGQTKTVRITGVPVAHKIFVMAADITEYKLAENALKESEEMFRNLAEQSPNMIFINQNGVVVYANMQCETSMGYTRKEICSPDFDFICLIAAEYRHITAKAWESHRKGIEAPAYEYEIVTKDGKRIPAIIATKLIHYHGGRAILGIVTDISELKHAQNELKEQQKSLEEKNIALKEILAQIETEKLGFKKQVTLNVEKMLLPAIGKLRTRASAPDKRYINMLEQNIKDLLSKFGLKLSSGPTKLSPRELEICNMIKNGISSKEIAEMLHLSIRTVDTHRNRIRRKLKINATDVNLASHLQNLT